MPSLKEVAEARTLMTEALDWSVMKWLAEKKRVRHSADAANLKLDQVEKQIHDDWPRAIQAAYEGNGSRGLSAEMLKAGSAVREKHDAALAARQDAEDTFAKAEKRLSVSLAREACHKAIAGWDLHEEAIRRAEAVSANK